MSKPMLVTLPFVLLLLDFWPLERLKKLKDLPALMVEKIPFFVLSAFSSVVTVYAQKAGGAIQTFETISLADRFLNAIVSYAKYVAMLFYPANLAVWYPFDRNFTAGQIIVSIILLVALTAFSVRQIKKRKYFFVGWFWFLGTLVPVIGLVQVGRQALADRYTYVPYIGLSIAFIWFLAEIVERVKIGKKAVAALCAASLLIFGALAFGQTSHWKTSETLYTHALSVTPKNYLVKNNFCNFLEKRNRLDQAAAQCEAAILDDPRLPEAYNSLGTVRVKQNKFDEARANFEKAIEANSNFTAAYANLAALETNRNDFDAAAANLEKAIASDREGFFDSARLADAYSSIATAAMRQKRYDAAEEFFRKALTVAPNNTDFQRNLALSLHLRGKSAEAVKILEEIIRKNPNLPEVYNTMGLIYAEQNRRPEAIAQFRKALEINPNFAPAQSNLRKALE
jgi:Tfp pilus assembly protein PilF